MAERIETDLNGTTYSGSYSVERGVEQLSNLLRPAPGRFNRRWLEGRLILGAGPDGLYGRPSPCLKGWKAN